MDLVDPRVEAYVDAATTAAPPELVALDAAARAELPSSGMLSGHVVGRFLETLVAVSGARRVLEIGTYAGSSALWLARGLPAGGTVVTCELDEGFAAWAAAHLAGAPHAEKIAIRVGPALETIASLEGPFDLVFIDADKTGYPAYLDAVLPKLAPGGLVVTDNMLRGGEVLAAAADQDPGTRAIAELTRRVAADEALVSTLLSVRDGLLLIRRA